MTWRPRALPRSSPPTTWTKLNVATGLAYIAYGTLLAAGTVEEMISRARLVTWSVTRKRGEAPLHDLSAKLKPLPGIDQVVAFGNTLHVSGRDPDRLEQSISQLQNSRIRMDPY